MKNVIRWVFTHEPALLAGVAGAVAVFFAFRYGTSASGDVQGLSGGLVAGIFGTLRGFVTSPAGRKALDVAQADVAALPDLVADVNKAKQLLGPALSHPKGLAGYLADHEGQVRRITSDTVDVVRGMLRASAPKVPAPDVPAPDVPAPDVPTVTCTSIPPSQPTVSEAAQPDVVEVPAPSPVAGEPTVPAAADVPPEVAALGKLLGTTS